MKMVPAPDLLIKYLKDVRINGLVMDNAQSIVDGTINGGGVLKMAKEAFNI